MSTLNVSNLAGPSNTGTAAVLSSVNGGPISGARNRIINGDMRIAQRGTSAFTITGAAAYTLDRFVAVGENSLGVFTVQQSSVAPAGFTNSLLATVTTADTTLAGSSVNYLVAQHIEGLNVADLGFGAAGASSITLSFWVRCSLTGTFGGAVTNAESATRAYGFTYSVNAANTWEYKTITIPGDTTGTWATNNTAGMVVTWSLGANAARKTTASQWSTTGGVYISGAAGESSIIDTNGATFYLTGVQLEAGSVATPFERRSYGQELVLCQRYYYRVSGEVGSRLGAGHNLSTTQATCATPFPVLLRVAPTALEQSGTAAHFDVQHANTATTCSAVPAFSAANQYMATSSFTVASGLTSGQGSNCRLANTSGYLGWSAEL